MIPIGLADDVLLGVARGAKNSRFGRILHRMSGPLMLADIAGTTAFAGKGLLASTFFGVVMANAGGVAGGALGARLGSMGGVIGSLAGYEAGHLVGEGVQAAIREVRTLNTLQVGRGYTDTPVAYTMRQRAVQELSTSLLNARQYLGKEALLFHE